jgi:hypothetical protein
MRPSFPVPKDIHHPSAASTGRKKVLYLLSNEGDLGSFGCRRGVLDARSEYYLMPLEKSTLFLANN